MYIIYTIFYRICIVYQFLNRGRIVYPPKITKLKLKLKIIGNGEVISNNLR